MTGYPDRGGVRGPDSSGGSVVSFVSGRPALLIFLFALLVRWTYAAATFSWMGVAGLLGSDSSSFISDAAEFAETLLRGDLGDWAWLGPDLSLMPVVTWLLAGLTILFGEDAPFVFVVLQGIADAGTCVLVYRIAQSVVPSQALFCGFFAALTPTLIVLSGIVYTDTVFTFFATLVLYAVLRWIDDPAWRWAIFAGVALGLAALTRAMILPWIVPLGLFVILCALVLGRPLGKVLAQLVVAGAIVALLFSSVLARNVVKYDAWALSPQSGNHFAFWIVPLVQEAADGTPWAMSVPRLQQQFNAIEQGERIDNPFVESQRLIAFGNERLTQLGTTAVVKAWVYGAILNVGSPAGTLSPPLASLPRTGFYDTPGESKAEKMANFLFASDNPLFGWITVLGSAGVLLARLLQLVGFISSLTGDRRTLLVVGFFGLWCAYVLVINGPIASPKYRLPIEPVLAVFAGFGVLVLRSGWARLSGKRRGAGSPA